MLRRQLRRLLLLPLLVLLQPRRLVALWREICRKHAFDSCDIT